MSAYRIIGMPALVLHASRESVGCKFGGSDIEQMNVHCERVNRTVQEEFLNRHEDLFFYDLPRFNQYLLDWIAWFNAERPHHGLGLLTPLDVLARYVGPECEIYWPSTAS
jgi:hypothetical protein